MIGARERLERLAAAGSLVARLLRNELVSPHEAVADTHGDESPVWGVQQAHFLIVGGQEEAGVALLGKLISLPPGLEEYRLLLLASCVAHGGEESLPESAREGSIVLVQQPVAALNRWLTRVQGWRKVLGV